jgi:hypothetical protein
MVPFQQGDPVSGHRKSAISDFHFLKGKRHLLDDPDPKFCRAIRKILRSAGLRDTLWQMNDDAGTSFALVDSSWVREAKSLEEGFAGADELAFYPAPRAAS